MLTLKKVLIISPTPTHPTNAGNRQHIKSLVSFFKEQHCEVHFLYLAYEDYPEAEMQQFFENNLHIIPKHLLFHNKKTPAYIFKKLKYILSNLKRKCQLGVGTISKNQYRYNGEVDNFTSVFVKPIIKSLRNKYNFDIVVCEYAYNSKYLEYFKSSVLKIIDTHDKFTDRFEVYLKNKLKPTWVSLYKNQEQKALKRANLILAVHDSDLSFFSKLSSRKTIVFNHIPEITKLTKNSTGKRLLYIASANDINKNTITDFINNVFPLVCKNHPDASLIIGGAICDKLNIERNNIILQGKFDDLSLFYSLGDVVINPEKSGTGYKVKAMEALSYGMPLVASTAGAVGINFPFTKHLFIADSPKDFVEILDTLFKNSDLLQKTSINAHNWISNHEKRIKNEFLFQLNTLETKK